MSLSGRKRALLLLFLFLIGAGGGFLWWVNAPLLPPAGSRFDIKSGTSLIRIARQLEDKGIIRSALAFRLFARWRGQEGSIQAGSYAFERAATPAQVLARLVAGDVLLTRVTIPEGFSLQQIIERLVALGVADRQRLQAAARDPQLIGRLGVQADNLEGFLFPETYSFVPGISERELLGMMVDEFERRYRSLQSELEGSSLGKFELVTLASIIQKETGLVDEMPLISSVFYNRLRSGIPLQTDPAVIYGIADFNGNLTRADLQRPSPYNTYLNRGLPPGPIASPGLAALRAAANPVKSRFLYFVARGDGSHQFSATLREHNKAVRRFQLRH